VFLTKKISQCPPIGGPWWTSLTTLTQLHLLIQPIRETQSHKHTFTFAALYAIRIRVVALLNFSMIL